jgi:cation diffusion facilitator CzcD-associated flavoprotein CzcO
LHNEFHVFIKRERDMTYQQNDDIIDCGKAVCVVGAGPGGLSAARALKGMGLAYEQFERHADVGGIWDMNNPGSPIYASAHFISSRDLSGLSAFRCPSPTRTTRPISRS